jgi:hypothetical protein
MSQRPAFSYGPGEPREVAPLVDPNNKAYIAQLEARVKELGEQLEFDRTAVCDGVVSLGKAIASRCWLKEDTRGSFEWDDDRYRAEFGAAVAELESALLPLKKISMDWAGCPMKADEVVAARIRQQEPSGVPVIIKKRVGCPDCGCGQTLPVDMQSCGCACHPKDRAAAQAVPVEPVGCECRRLIAEVVHAYRAFPDEWPVDPAKPEEQNSRLRTVMVTFGYLLKPLRSLRAALSTPCPKASPCQRCSKLESNLRVARCNERDYVGAINDAIRVLTEHFFAHDPKGDLPPCLSAGGMLAQCVESVLAQHRDSVAECDSLRERVAGLAKALADEEEAHAMTIRMHRAPDEPAPQNQEGRR